MNHRPITVCVLLILLGGCAAQDAAKLTAARTQATTEIANEQDMESALQTQIAALPATDPLRKTLEPQLARLDAIIARGQQYVPLADAAIQSVQDGPIDPNLQAAASAIPYGSLTLAVIGLIWGIVKHVQAGNLVDEHVQMQQAFKQVVSALDAALPGPTAIQKTAIAGELDADVKARVAAVRAS
jgi:hypothetical protein